MTLSRLEVAGPDEVIQGINGGRGWLATEYSGHHGGSWKANLRRIEREERVAQMRIQFEQILY
jgi:hypothetical protein